MTECPKCKGYGIVGDAVPDILRGRGHVFSSNECPQCHGSGEVEITNEEWLKSLDTEQLAEFLFRVWENGYHSTIDIRIPFNIPFDTKWLKQTHKE